MQQNEITFGPMPAEIKAKIDSYPSSVSTVLFEIRQLIIDVALELKLSELSESLKWGEPSVSSKIGSTVRYDWKAKMPEYVCVYFNCKTTLVETFKEVYGEVFTYSTNRALIFEIGVPLPIEALKHCFAMSLRYKKLKHLELLGA